MTKTVDYGLMDRLDKLRLDPPEDSKAPGDSETSEERKAREALEPSIAFLGALFEIRKGRFFHFFEMDRPSFDLLTFKNSFLNHFVKNPPSDLDDCYRALHRSFLREHLLEEKINLKDALPLVVLIVLAWMVPMVALFVAYLAPALSSLVSMSALGGLMLLIGAASMAVLVVGTIYAMKGVFRLRESRLVTNAIYSQKETLDEVLADPSLSSHWRPLQHTRKARSAFFHRLTCDKNSPDAIELLQKLDREAIKPGGPIGYTKIAEEVPIPPLTFTNDQNGSDNDEDTASFDGYS